MGPSLKGSEGLCGLVQGMLETVRNSQHGHASVFGQIASSTGVTRSARAELARKTPKKKTADPSAEEAEREERSLRRARAREEVATAGGAPQGGALGAGRSLWKSKPDPLFSLAFHRETLDRRGVSAKILGARRTAALIPAHLRSPEGYLETPGS